MSKPLRAWSAAAAGYLALAAVLLGRTALAPTERIVGFLQIDQMDTAWLRLAASRLLYTTPGDWPMSGEMHAPAGYPLGYLLPNVLDHLTGGPLALALPWPLSDNLWWWLVLTANGLAAHHLGRTLGGSHAAGALCGVAFATCEPVLREANLAHAPQAMVFSAPLYLLALIQVLRGQSGWRSSVAMGSWMAVAALTYWYHALFLACLSSPAFLATLWEERRAPGPLLSRVTLAVGVTLVLCVLPLAWYLDSWEALPNSDASNVLPDLGRTALIEVIEPRWQFVLAQSGDLLWWLRAEPLDRSNRVSLVLLVAALLSGRRWRWWVAAAIGGLLVMGPYLKWGEDPVLIGGQPLALPWHWLGEASELLARLTWPQRWGLIVPLALLPLAARAPRPAWLAGLLLVETLLMSSNAPLASTRVTQFAGWRSLAKAPGPVLSLPLDRRGPVGPSLAFGYRAAGVPMVNPWAIPPDAHPQEAWEDWQAGSAFAQWAARADGGDYDAPLPEGALEGLAADGIAVVVVDVTPGGVVPASRRKRWVKRLEERAGPPVDYGSVLAWWLLPPDGGVPKAMERGDVWRQRQRNLLDDEALLTGDTVIRKVPWNPW